MLGQHSITKEYPSFTCYFCGAWLEGRQKKLVLDRVGQEQHKDYFLGGSESICKTLEYLLRNTSSWHLSSEPARGSVPGPIFPKGPLLQSQAEWR